MPALPLTIEVFEEFVVDRRTLPYSPVSPGLSTVPGTEESLREWVVL